MKDANKNYILYMYPNLQVNLSESGVKVLHLIVYWYDLCFRSAVGWQKEMITNLKTFVFPCLNLFYALDQEKNIRGRTLQQGAELSLIYLPMDDINIECSSCIVCFSSPFLLTY